MDSVKDVLPVLPSLFEEFMDIENYKFYTKKLLDNKYLCFAYDESKIIEAIKKTNLTIGQVSDIYFAQIEFESVLDNNSQSCMKVDNICLSYIDNILAQIPIMLKVEINNSIDIKNIKLSKDKIYINSGSKYIDKKSSYMLSFVFILFSIFTFSKIISNNQIIQNIPNQIDTLRDKHNTPQTLIQTKSIIAKLEKRYNSQIKIRELFEYIFMIKKNLGGTLISIDFKENSLVLKCKDIDKKRLSKYLQKRYKLNSTVVKDKVVTIGLKI